MYFKQILITLFVCLLNACLFATSLYSFEFTVIDGTDKTPLIGVTVFKKGNLETGAVSDFEGRVIIEDVTAWDTLVISYMGYKEKEMRVEDIRRQGKIVQLYPTDYGLAPIVVTAGNKWGENISNLNTRVSVITSEEIELKNPNNTAKMIENSGVFVQRSQMGGGSPIIRGFEANKVMIVIDGVRMNNAIYRNGHLQNILTIDNNALERTEILFGPSAVIYGSDALGGVISLYTKTPKITHTDSAYIDFDVMTRFASVNNEKSFNLSLTNGGKKWGSFTSVTYSDFGDLRAGTNFPKLRDTTISFEDWKRPDFVAVINGDDIVVPNDDPFRQIGTGYTQLDVINKIKFQPSLNYHFTLNTQYSTSSDVPRYDRLVERKNGLPKFAEWNYGPQKRLFLSLQSEVIKPNALFTKGRFIAAFQKIDEDRIQRKRKNVLREFRQEDVYVTSFNFDFKKELDENNVSTLLYGVEYTYNYVSSYATAVNIFEGQQFNSVITRYPSNGSSMQNIAGYANYKYQPSQAFNVIAGIRYTNVKLSSNFGSNDVIQWPFDKIEMDEGDLTGSLGFAYAPKSKWQVKGAFSTGYRAPNVDDFAKIRAKDGFITIPNPDLKSEYALNTEFTLAKQFDFGENAYSTTSPPDNFLSLAATGYYTYIYDAMVRKESNLPGTEENILIADGEENTTIANFNAASGRIYGISTSMELNLRKEWIINASYNWIKGQYTEGVTEQDTLLPLSHIPPSYGNLGISYRKKKIELSFDVIYNARKPLEEYDPTSGNSDNLSRALPTYGTPAWATLNLYSSFYFGKNNNLSVNFAVENILDTHYRQFSSSVSAPGRNFIISLRGKF